MRPGKPDDKGNFTDPTVHLGQILADDFWPEYQGPMNCVIGEVYRPKQPQVTVTEEAAMYEPPPGKETHQVKWVSKAEEILAGPPLTSYYTASKFIQHLDYLLEQQDGKASGPEGYTPLKDDLQVKFPGQFNLRIGPRRNKPRKVWPPNSARESAPGYDNRSGSIDEPASQQGPPRTSLPPPAVKSSKDNMEDGATSFESGEYSKQEDPPRFLSPQPAAAPKPREEREVTSPYESGSPVTT